MKTLVVLACLAFLAPALAQAQDTAAYVQSNCGTCHQLAGPASEAIDVREQRGGPPLFYAGNKFQQEWLVVWLQDPVRIRPAGDYPIAHVQGTADGDVVDESKLSPHPVLQHEQAEEVGAYLMTLKAHDDLIAAEEFKPVSVSPRMGAMDFVKFKGCGGCHKDTPEYGGVSGPELYTAWGRLQPEFIASYIRDPVAWEPRSLMPNKHLDSGSINKLVNYLRAIGEKGGDGQ